MTILRQVKNVSGPWHALLGLRGATGSLQGLSFAPISAKDCGKAREFSDHNPIHNTVNLAHPVFTVWGANTDVGKTLFSIGLTRAIVQSKENLLYLKPVQTGFPNDCDSRLVAAGLGVTPTYGTHAASLLNSGAQVPDSHRFDDSSASGSRSLPAPDSVPARPQAHTEFAWRKPVSPHVAVADEGRLVPDSAIQAAVARHLASFQASAVQDAAAAFALVETAGGVASPGPSGNLQCDILRSMRLPAILIGDGRLGGISSTIAAFEVLNTSP